MFQSLQYDVFLNEARACLNNPKKYSDIADPSIIFFFVFRCIFIEGYVAVCFVFFLSPFRRRRGREYLVLRIPSLRYLYIIHSFTFHFFQLTSFSVGGARAHRMMSLTGPAARSSTIKSHSACHRGKEPDPGSSVHSGSITACSYRALKWAAAGQAA